jgi:hypothetical protein
VAEAAGLVVLAFEHLDWREVDTAALLLLHLAMVTLLDLSCTRSGRATSVSDYFWFHVAFAGFLVRFLVVLGQLEQLGVPA